MAGALTEKGLESSATVVSPCANLAKIARRVGSASAAKVELRVSLEGIAEF